jgi:RNA polymerase sigma-70 factor (ECF subfamily)
MADKLAEFEAERRRLFGLAYRMLGSASDAEDVVQDAFLRWNGADRDSVESPSAWLTTVAVNLCRSSLSSARARRQRYIGTWLPEPVLTADGALGPMETAEQRESVSLALLTLMEQLTPAERAVFVLRESFGYSHREIAGILGVSETGSRQLFRRARQRLGAPRPRFHPGPGEWQRLVGQFLAAATDGDVAGLERLLADDAIYWADGGGQMPVARRPVAGAARLARFVAVAFRAFATHPAFTPINEMRAAEVNGEPGVLARADGSLVALVALEMSSGQITALRVAANPAKLNFAATQARKLSRSEHLSGLVLVTDDR